MHYLSLVGRTSKLFSNDLHKNKDILSSNISNSKFLVIGGAGSIGQSVVREIFKRNPACLHVVDLSENNMVELVRDIRSSVGYNDGDFRTFSIDCDSLEFDSLMLKYGPYDYVFNLSAMKHVRSEKDPFTLMRMVIVNIFNTIKTMNLANNQKTKKYFCVSTDKAANPVNMMGASKRIMEMFLMQESINTSLDISMARFANVAFSDGSLLHGFNQRFAKKQPITAPLDVKRYFLTPQESGELCLLSAILGDNMEIFFPKLNEELHLITFAEIARRFVESYGYKCYECSSEDEARKKASELIKKKQWPCYFFKSDTTGEKDFEEFYTSQESLDLSTHIDIGIVKPDIIIDEKKLHSFLNNIDELRTNGSWEKQDILSLFCDLLPDFDHKELGKDLDQKM